jgi:hypothetical protein
MQSDVTTKHTKHTKLGPYGRNQLVLLFTKPCGHLGSTGIYSVARVLVCFVVTSSALLRFSSTQRKIRARRPLQRGQDSQRFRSTAATHARLRPEANANRRPFWPPEEGTPKIRQQLNTAYTRRLALRHPRNGRRDAGGDAAGSAIGATSEGLHYLPISRILAILQVAKAESPAPKIES